MSFFDELKRRNVFRVGLAYVVVAWVLLQAIDFTLDIISAPNWVMQVFLLAGVAGLPLVLIFSWVFEMTAEGIKLESEVDRSQSVTRTTGRRLDRTIIIFLGIAVMLLLADRFVSGSGSVSPPAEKPNLTPSVQSVAVLPFVNMSSDPEQEYFSDGLSEELLNRLAQNEQLQVAARTSSFQFKGQNQDISEIGRQLKVDHILEGSVRKSSNRLRITAQLIEVESGFHLWSETYEREITDIFSIQDDISLAISKALEAELDATSAPANSQPTENLVAYQRYLEARYLLAQRGEANMMRANTLFKQAVELDPNFSNAMSGMAFSYALLPAYGSTVSTQQARAEIKASANKAIQIDPGNAEAYVALARGGIYEDFNATRQHYKKAFELAPNNAEILNLYADYMVQTGDFQAAVALEKRAIELDPLTAVHYSDMAFALYPLGRYQEGLEYGRTSARLAPDSLDRADALVTGLLTTGLYNEAIQIIHHFEQQADSDAGYINMWWCMLYFQQEDEQNLRKKVDERVLMAETGNGDYNYTITAFYTAWLDGTDAALPILAKSYKKREWLLTWPEYFYLPEDISDDPAWLAFWHQPGLAELMGLRRQNKTQDRIGHWKARP